MRQIILSVVVICSLLNCSYNRNSNEKQNIDNALLKDFLSKFDSLSLPLTITRKDYSKYSYLDFDITNPSSPSNPFYQRVEAKHYKFLGDTSKVDTLNTFYYLFKTHFKDFTLIFYQQINSCKESYWTRMNVLDFNGNIIDTLTLAGIKIYGNEKTASISKDWKVSTTLYHYLPEEPLKKGIVIEELKEDFEVSPDGHFKRTSSSKQKGYFEIIEDVFVPYKE